MDPWHAFTIGAGFGIVGFVGALWVWLLWGEERS